MKILSFGSRREDHNALQLLFDGEKSITFPRARKLKQALSNLHKDTSRENLLYLMAIATNNQYGLKANSALKQYLRENSQIADLQMENNDWNAQLQDSIRHGINSMPKDKRAAFEAQFTKIFIEQKDLTNDERRLIRYREYISKSKPMQVALRKSETKASALKSLKFLDYFIASSEISMKDKVYVLSKLSRMMSDKYKINKQLSDKKAQLFGEIINDLIIKTPESPILTTKDCSQEQHGSCAAISMARKLLVYEDKKAYVDTVLSEVSIKPYMDIYDITRLSEFKDDGKNHHEKRAPKIRVDKAKIDYEKALSQGYRIIDASVLNWMLIAGSIGDGKINLEDYEPFDSKHNAFFHDTRTVLPADDEYEERHCMLQTLIKANNLLEDYDKDVLRKKVKQSVWEQDGAALQAEKGQSYNEIRTVIDQIAPDKSVSEKSSAINGLTKLKNVNVKNNNSELKRQIVEHFTRQFGKKYFKLLNANSQNLLKPVRKFVEINDKIEGLKDSRIADKKQLFKLGVAQREVLLESASLSGLRPFLYKDLNLSDRHTQIQNEITRFKKLVKENPNSPYLANFQKRNKLKTVDIPAALDGLDRIFNKEIPETRDALLDAYNMSYKKILLHLINSDIKEHQSGDYSYMNNLCPEINMTPNPKQFEKKLLSIKERIEKSNNDAELDAIIKEIKSDGKNEIVLNFVNQLSKNLIQLIQEDKFDVVQQSFSDKYKPSTPEEALSQIETILSDINKVIQQEEVVAKRLGYPNEVNVIAKKAENLGIILSQETIDDLEKKFEDISKFKEKYDKTQDTDDIHVGDILKFTDKQSQALKQVEKNISKFRRTVKQDYKYLNIELKEYLEQLYEELGKRKGLFWVAEEGHSGLYDLESVRIIEQMTGRPYYIEKDPDVIAKSVKDGVGSGASSTMVKYDEYSGHAQYIADVKPVKYKDGKTGKIKVADALLHDNTWGDREQKGRFTDKDKLLRTDYGRGYGSPKGFILDESGLAGAFVDDFKFDYGVDTSERTSKAFEGDIPEMDAEQGYYPVMMAARMPGTDPRIEKRITQIFNYLFNIKNTESAINNLFVALDKVKGSVQLKSLNSVDENISKISERLLKQIGGQGNKPLSIDEFEALPQSNPLKIIVNKLIMRKALEISDNDDKFESLKTQAGLEHYKETYLKKLVDSWMEVASKTLIKAPNDLYSQIIEDIQDDIIALQEKQDAGLLDFSKYLKKNIREVVAANPDVIGETVIKQIMKKTTSMIAKDYGFEDVSEEKKNEFIAKLEKSLRENFYPKSIQDFEDDIELKYLLKFIDKKYNPRTDEEVLEIFKKFVNTPKKELKNIFDKVTFEDIGVKFDSPENVLKMIQAGNDLETDRFENETRYHYFNEFLPVNPKYGKYAVSKELANFNRQYRLIDVDLSTIGGEKYLNEGKDFAFWKYKCRPAIPRVKIKTEDELNVLIERNLKNISETVSSLRNYKITKKFLHEFDYLRKVIDERDIDSQKIKLQNTILSLKKLSLIDPAMKPAEENLDKILFEVSGKNVDYEKLHQYIENVNAAKNEALSDYTITNIEELIEHSEKELHSMKNFVAINILPKYQSKVSHLLNLWINDVAKKPATAYEKPYSDLVQAILKHHVLNEPSELLHYTVKFASDTDNKMSKEDYTQILSGLKELVKEAYQKSNKVNLEYKLMKAAKLGMATKFKDYIKTNDMDLTLTDNSKVPALSEKGMNFIIESLSNLGANQDTLMLFVEQTGLVDELLNTIYKIDFRAEKKQLLQMAKNMLIQQTIQSKLNENFEKVFDKINPDIQFESRQQLEDIYKQICDVLDNSQYDKKNPKYSADFYKKEFKDILDTLDIDQLKHLKLDEVVSGIHSSIEKMLTKGLEQLADNATLKINVLYSKICILQNVRLVADSKEDKKRCDFMETIQSTIDFAVNVFQKAGLNVH